MIEGRKKSKLQTIIEYGTIFVLLCVSVYAHFKEKDKGTSKDSGLEEKTKGIIIQNSPDSSYIDTTNYQTPDSTSIMY